MDIVGISAFYHDSAASLVRDGVVIAAAQEERFSRIKHDASFPAGALRWCLEEGEVEPGGIDAVAYYEKPLTSFVRVLRSFAGAGLAGARTFPKAVGEWSSNRFWTGFHVQRGIKELGWAPPRDIVYCEHHESHAAAAFYASPFERAAVLTFDGVGEWATSSIAVGRAGRLTMLEEMRFPHSIGLLYSAFTHHAGFRVNSGEYKLMGLAPYGEPRYVDRILEHLVDLRDDGSFILDQRYFDYLAGRRMTSRRFDALFDGPARRPEDPITQRDADLARSIQQVVEQIVLAMAEHAREITGESLAALAGGVALNCVANAKLRDAGVFEELWVQPAAGDAGSAIGAALHATHQTFGVPRKVSGADAMHGALLGPSFDRDGIATELVAAGRPHVRITDPGARAARVAALLDEGAVVGLFQGRMEFGPRALGNRSIIADPRRPDMQSVLNQKIKKRESFRPFAPAVLAEHAAEWFDLPGPSPYMLFTAPVRSFGAVEGQAVRAHANIHDALDMEGRLAAVRSDIPAVTHVDGSARVQTVDAERSPQLYSLLQAFHARTGCPVIVNTSFNVRGEPIVHTPDDAYRCFMTTDMDWLLLEDCLLAKEDQPPWTGPPAPLVDD